MDSPGIKTLNADILYLISRTVSEGWEGHERAQGLVSLASVCNGLRAMVLPRLFAEVQWPHRSKTDETEGLAFFPQSLWRYFRHFRLQWPQEWLDNYPPKWGEFGADTTFSGSPYIPRDIGKLVDALPSMQITQFTIQCPYIPPTSLVSALLRSTTLTTLVCEDTPLDLPFPTDAPIPTLRSVKLVAVGEAIRVGDGKVDTAIADTYRYWVCGWKKRYRARRELRLPLEAMTASALLRRHAAHLHTVQLSGDFCTPSRLAAVDWPALDTLILTGHVPERDGVPFGAVLARMPRVRDVRLLLAKTPHRLLQILPRPSAAPPPPLPPTLTRLAVSTACELDGLLPHAAGLDALTVLSIIDYPRVPIALSLGDAAQVVRDVAWGGAPLRRLRLMIEDKVTPMFCHTIAMRLPRLEQLEIELCGYHDGKTVFDWAEFAGALQPLAHLHALRLCIQFPEYDDTDGPAPRPWAADRAQCAHFLAAALPALRTVGFEFRERTGTHKYQDSWLDFRVVRGPGAEKGGGCCVVPLPMSWYVFPEVWETVDRA